MCMEYVWKSSLWIGIFQRATNEQEHYWPTIYRAGANVVSTITSLIYCRVEMCMHNKCMGLLGNLKLVSWYKRTLCHPVWSVIILVIKQIKLPLCSRPILLITRIHDFKLVSVKRRLRSVVFSHGNRDLKHWRWNARRWCFATQADWAKGFIFSGENEV